MITRESELAILRTLADDLAAELTMKNSLTGAMDIRVTFYLSCDLYRVLPNGRPIRVRLADLVNYMSRAHYWRAVPKPRGV